jgi:4-aminobutyrate---pyruvate transaminase
MRPLSNFKARDVEALLHPTTNLWVHRTAGPLVLERGEGIYVVDTDGKKYIEGLAGLWCTALGYGNRELVETAKEQMEKLSFTHLFGGRSHEPAIELAETIKRLAPCPTSKVFFTASGSETNDSQIKLAWYYNNAIGRPQKKKIISRVKGYHGVTIASASLTGLPVFHADFDLPMSMVRHTATPHHYRGAHEGESEADFATRLVADLEALIHTEGADTIAAFIAEPVMGAGGVIVPPATYFEKVSALLQKHDIAFIADEVICGFGRTGNWFGSQTFNAQPTTISMAKAITSAYFPLGALTVPEHVHEALVDSSKRLGVFAHGFTYSGHPVGSAIANKAIAIYERDDIVGHVRRVAPVFQGYLERLADHPLVGEARGVGLIGGLELVRDKKTKQSFDPKLAVGAKVTSFAQDEGLICRPVGGDTIGLCPPLIITADQIDDLFGRLETALDRALDWATKEGHFVAH